MRSSYPPEYNYLSIPNVAHICHDANVAFCAATGNLLQYPWHLASPLTKASVIGRVAAILKDRDLDAGEAHAIWRSDLELAGWIWAPEKSEELRSHPCLKDFDELTKTQQHKVHLFLATVRSVQDLVDERSI